MKVWSCEDDDGDGSKEDDDDEDDKVEEVVAVELRLVEETESSFNLEEELVVTKVDLDDTFSEGETAGTFEVLKRVFKFRLKLKQSRILSKN